MTFSELNTSANSTNTTLPNESLNFSNNNSSIYLPNISNSSFGSMDTNELNTSDDSVNTTRESFGGKSKKTKRTKRTKRNIKTKRTKKSKNMKKSQKRKNTSKYPHGSCCKCTCCVRRNRKSNKLHKRKTIKK